MKTLILIDFDDDLFNEEEVDELFFITENAGKSIDFEIELSATDHTQLLENDAGLSTIPPLTFIDEKDIDVLDVPAIRFVPEDCNAETIVDVFICCLLYTSPSPRDGLLSRMPSSA